MNSDKLFAGCYLFVSLLWLGYVIFLQTNQLLEIAFAWGSGFTFAVAVAFWHRAIGWSSQ